MRRRVGGILADEMALSNLEMHLGALRADDQPKLPLDVLLETPINTAAK